MSPKEVSNLSMHSRFIYGLGVGYEVMNVHCGCPWAEMDRQTAGYKLCVWIVLDSCVLQLPGLSDM